MTEVACWAHARRKFFDAQDTRRQAGGRDAGAGRRAVRRRAAEAEGGGRTAATAARISRQEQQRAGPGADQGWLDAEGEIVLPRSPMAAAISYAQNQWAALNVYATQGFLNIDNNAAERALKRVAIGRKNWLFAGHDAAAGTMRGSGR